MGESNKHIELVDLATTFIKKLIPETNNKLIFSDSPKEIDKPPIIYEQVRPDVFYNYQGLLIIGEAKTIKDFDTLHSKHQFHSYLDYCEKYQGTSILVISIPWELSKTVKNFFIRIKHKQILKTRIYIINELNNVEEV